MDQFQSATFFIGKGVKLRTRHCGGCSHLGISPLLLRIILSAMRHSSKTQQRLEPLGNGLFRLESASGGGPVGEVVRFAEQSGKVVRMYTGESYRDRVKP